jgi:hypothetical protein
MGQEGWQHRQPKRDAGEQQQLDGRAPEPLMRLAGQGLAGEDVSVDMI